MITAVPRSTTQLRSRLVLGSSVIGQGERPDCRDRLHRMFYKRIPELMVSFVQVMTRKGIDRWHVGMVLHKAGIELGRRQYQGTTGANARRIAPVRGKIRSLNGRILVYHLGYEDNFKERI